jgi:hypothetical protein
VATGDQRAIADFLAAVEKLCTSDDADTHNVVEVSFLEWLVVDPGPRERAAIEVIRRLSGPTTIADLVREPVCGSDGTFVGGRPPLPGQQCLEHRVGVVATAAPAPAPVILALGSGNARTRAG